MKKGILIAVFSLLLLSGFMGCHKESRRVEVLSRDTLIEVLADLHISSSAVQVNQASTTEQNEARRNAYFDWVMRKHHITYQQFDTSFKYYLNQADRFSKMYDQVIMRIKEKALENKRTPKEEAIRNDSIKKDSLQRAVIQKAAMKTDSIRADSMKRANLKLEAVQKAAFKKDSIRIVNLKKAEYKKEASINEALKKTLLKKDTVKKDTVKRTKVLKKVVPTTK